MNMCKSMVDVSNFYLPYSSHAAKYFSAFGYEGFVQLAARNYLELVAYLLLSMFIIKVEKIERYNVYLTAVVMSTVFLYAVTKIGQISEFLYFQF